MNNDLRELRAKMNEFYRKDEEECDHVLIKTAEFLPAVRQSIQTRAADLVNAIREKKVKHFGIEALLQKYNLSSNEGIALMCLAEAMLRIPDKATADKLIADKIGGADWAENAADSDSFFVNAAGWGLVLTGKILKPDSSHSWIHAFKSMVQKISKPMIRTAVGKVMEMLGDQFVMGETIAEAQERALKLMPQGYLFSYDMLGEAARTQEDAEKYFNAYVGAIEAIGNQAHAGPIRSSGISIKLSALHPRYEFAHHDEVVSSLVPKLKQLTVLAKKYNIALTVDAEEADRLDLSLDIIQAVFCDPEFMDWEGLGLAVQSYQKRCFYLIDWLVALAQKQKKRWFVRLIKGAYWDAEIKISQVGGYSGYPVFTRKIATDVSFLACARKILAHPDCFYSQFATHNAFTVAAILELAGNRTDFEFQCLHGMGYTLYDEVLEKINARVPCRVYAPVGGHRDLLAYLVRRLLENGANSSFVHRVIDKNYAIADLIQDPVEQLKSLKPKANPYLPLPRLLYGNNRLNSLGLDFSNPVEFSELEIAYRGYAQKTWQAESTLAKPEECLVTCQVLSPTDHTKVGSVKEVNEAYFENALIRAKTAYQTWSKTPVNERASCLERAADLLEKNRFEFMYLATREAGKTLFDANAELREAVDFCRYYAEQARLQLVPKNMPGPTGETNILNLHPRGIIACISPWNFPLAIFLGQVTAALVTGNVVLAKPAGQTPLIAARAVEILHEAGIPKEVLQLVIASGRLVGEKIIADERVKGVIFTGSTATAQTINQTLAARKGAIVPLIAETGGQNAMIVDSSALPEQVVQDVIVSAFGSTGQRCSALRVLYLQEDIADRVIHLLQGAMAELTINDPILLSTDIGPVIDKTAQKTLQDHCHYLEQLSEVKLISKINLTADQESNAFFPPCAYEIPNLEVLPHEVFGPILHVIRYASENLDQVIDQINATGFGLTMGVQSRISETADYISDRINAGNIYVNRNMIGAVVGVQPFGGEGLSGTGPKAGGPHYLLRLCTEKTITINTTAAGGNASLMTAVETGGI